MPTVGWPPAELLTAAQLQHINASAASWTAGDADADLRLRRRARAAAAACRSSQRLLLDGGGWCLGRMANATLFGSERVVQLPKGISYKLPGSHVEADELILSRLARLARIGEITNLSINDFGAGVGQYGHTLRSRHSGVQWRGWDGAGDVVTYTGGAVSFFDLTLPLALPRADWVVSLEVGEHVPRSHELQFIRNLHAHNCRGVLLSWAWYGGFQHVNRRAWRMAGMRAWREG